MGLFGKSDDTVHSGSLWSRLTKNRKQEQQKPVADSSTSREGPGKQPSQQSKHQKQTKPPVIRVSEDQRKDNFRLSLQSLRPKSHAGSSSQNRASCLGTEQLDSRLRTSKLQCEQLKRKVATISVECSKLESQCNELREVKEQLLSFQSDITMLKRKEKGYFEIQQRIGHLEDENYAMVDQIEHIRAKLSDLQTEIRPDLIHKRLDQLESDDHKLTSITLQHRRDHDRFSLEVGNQLVETFVTQQTIYEEFHRLQHRLVSVERQNQIMSDLIHFHCNNAAIGGTRTLMSNSHSSRGAGSMLASTEATSSSFSPSFSDQDAEKTNTSPSNNEWQFTDQGDSLFLCDTLNKSTEGNRESIFKDIKNKNYYKIDFTAESESLTTLHLTDLSAALSASIISTEEPPTSSTIPVSSSDIHQTNASNTSNMGPLVNKSICDHRNEMASTITHQRDDGYYSTSHDGTMATDSNNLTDSAMTQQSVTVFLDNKERYLILTRHVQKSRGRSLRLLPLVLSDCKMLIKSSLDLESHMYNRSLRKKQHKQRESLVLYEGDVAQVFSDTELYGTRFCIDSDIDDEDTPSLFKNSKLKPLKPTFGYPLQKSMKIESKHISNLPPLIENVSDGERKIEIKSTKKSRIVPPRVRPKSINNSIVKKSTPDTLAAHDLAPVDYSDAICEAKQSVSVKPPKYSPCLKPVKAKIIESLKLSPNSSSPRKPPQRKAFVKPPPIPPRPKKRFDVSQRTSPYCDLASLDYVNDPPIRMSPEGCQDVRGSSSQMVRKFRDFTAPVTWSNGFSSTNVDDCYMEDDDDMKIVRPDDHIEEYYDQEFIAELENYQLPNSSVERLVRQHFK